MGALLIGYARVSTDDQDLTAQQIALAALGVDRVYLDHGLTGTNRNRPGLREALAACRDGDTLVVTKLDRLARSLPDARGIADELTVRQVRFSLGGVVYDPTDAVGRLLFNVLAMAAEFEADLISMRTREGMRSPRPGVGYAGRNPSSPRARKHTCSRCTPPATTPPASLANYSVSPAPRSTEHWTAHVRATRSPMRDSSHTAQLHSRRDAQGPPARQTRVRYDHPGPTATPARYRYAFRHWDCPSSRALPLTSCWAALTSTVT